MPERVRRLLPNAITVIRLLMATAFFAHMQALAQLQRDGRDQFEVGLLEGRLALAAR